MSILNPYISFKDQAREALEFYHGVFGGELNVSSFAEFGMEVQPGEENLVMHGQLTTPSGFTLMAADTPTGMTYDDGSRITVSLSGDEEAELRGYWDKLADGGTVSMPLEKAPWGDSFGQLVDRFGVSWMLNISGGGQ